MAREARWPAVKLNRTNHRHRQYSIVDGSIFCASVCCEVILSEEKRNRKEKLRTLKRVSLRKPLIRPTCINFNSSNAALEGCREAGI